MYIQAQNALFLSDFKEIRTSFNRFSKDTQMSTCMKIHPVEAEMIHSDRRTDMMKLIVAFRNFEKHV